MTTNFKKLFSLRSLIKMKEYPCHILFLIASIAHSGLSFPQLLQSPSQGALQPSPGCLSPPSGLFPVALLFIMYINLVALA